jgi:type VI secretion system protein ImpL
VFWVLSALVVLILWALWLTLRLMELITIGMWAPIVGSLLVVVGVVGSIFYRRWREKKAAAALESAIAQQGAQQAMNARPERRAEIQELQKQVAEGISPSSRRSSAQGRGRGRSTRCPGT